MLLTSEFLPISIYISYEESNFIFVAILNFFEPPIKCPQVSYPLKVEQVDIYRKYLSLTNGCRLVIIMLVCHYTKKHSVVKSGNISGLEIPKKNITYVVTSDESCFGG